ncbi:MAG: CoA ester lyase [bacterium]|nr:CoA ester lyase [bacterium]
MPKPDHGLKTFRSLLFVPGHREALFEKAARAGADALVLDLEDAVPAAYKDLARKAARQALDRGVFGDATVFVRVNSLPSRLTADDLEVFASDRVTGFVYPQASSSVELEEVNQLLLKIEKSNRFEPNRFALLPLLESARGVLHAFSILTACNRIAAAIFGCEDYLADLQGRHCENEQSLLWARSQVAAAARAAQIEPIDAPYVKVHDLDGLKQFAEMGRSLGFSGMLTLSPRQIPVIHQIYTPTPEEIQQARSLVAAAEAAQQQGVFISGGEFVSPPTVRAAKKLLARAEGMALPGAKAPDYTK